MAEWFAAGVAAQVVVAARAGRLRDELQLTRARTQRYHALLERCEVEAFPVPAFRVKVFEPVLESGDVVFPHRRGDVHPLRELRGAVDHARKCADDDEANVMALQSGQLLVRVERGSPLGHGSALSG